MTLILAALLLTAPLQDPAADDARIAKLIDQLGADFLDERDQAKQELERIGKPAEKPLAAALRRPDSRVRRVALELLTALRSSAALPAAAELFQGDDDAEVREAAFRLFVALGKEAEEPLIGALGSPSAEIRKRAVESLSDFRSEKAVPRLAELYAREPVKAVKDAAYRAVLQSGRSAEPLLLQWLQDPDPVVRKEVLQAFRGSSSEAVAAAVAKQFLLEAAEMPLQQAFQFLIQGSEKSEATFLEGLKSPRPQTRRCSIDGLRVVKSRKALAPVSEIFLGDATPELLSAAADFLQAQGAEAEPALRRALDGTSRPALLRSIQMLGELGSEPALPRIAALYRDDPAHDVHEKAFEYFRRLGLRAEKELLDALSDADKEIRIQAIVALGDVKSERAIPLLIERLNQLDVRIREASEAALVSIGPRALEAISKAVTDGRLKRSAADEIDAQFARCEVERLLELQMGDDATGFYEGQFKDLEAFGKARAVPVLVRILREPVYSPLRAGNKDRVRDFNTRVKELAIKALGEFGGKEGLDALRAFRETWVPQAPPANLQQETLMALFRLGETKPLEGFLQDWRARIDRSLQSARPEDRADACTMLFVVAMCQHRIGRRQESIQSYLELVRVAEEGKLNPLSSSEATAMYNLACAYSLTGEKAKAVDWLLRAVKLGFRDRAWMKIDKDLDPIRGEAAFQKLMGDDALFEKRGDADEFPERGDPRPLPDK